MKKIFATFLLLLFIKPICSFGQSQDYVNQTKYWFFRNRLINEFMKVGPDQGESLPLNRISTTDRAGNSGDGTVTPAGFYIGVLASELYILKQTGQDTYQTRLELYYALNAIKRLDETAETYNFCDTDPGYPRAKNCIGTGKDWNGFLLRDDINCDPSSPISKYFQTKMSNNKFALTTQFGPNISITSCGGDPAQVTKNDISHDQLNNLFIGLRLVQKLLDGSETFTPPTPGAVPVNLKDFAITIGTKIFTWMAYNPLNTVDPTDFINNNCNYLERFIAVCSKKVANISVCSWIPSTINYVVCGKISPFVDKQGRIPWLIMNPVTKQPACMSILGAAYPIGESAGYAATGGLLTGLSSSSFPVSKDAQNMWQLLSGYLGLSSLSDNYKILGQAAIGNSWEVFCPCYQDYCVKKVFGKCVYTIQIPVFGSNCCSGNTKNIIDLQAWNSRYQYFALLYNVLWGTNGYTINDYDTFFQNAINSAPCVGPYFNGAPFASTYQWASDYMLNSADEGTNTKWSNGDPANLGEYNGLDYMLMYNLNNIYHKNYAYYTNYADNLKITNRAIDNTKEYYNARSYLDDLNQYQNGFIDVQNLTVKNTSSVDMRAGQKITISAPFIVQAGSTFKGRIYQPPINSDWEMTICSHMDANGEPALDGHRLAADPNIYNYSVDSSNTKSSLGNNFPNPFNNTTIIPYFVSEPGSVQMNVIDSYGRLIQELVNKNDHAIGHFTIEFNSNNLANGVYFYLLKTKDYSDIKRMIIIN
jgi:hypothetical protein